MKMKSFLFLNVQNQLTSSSSWAWDSLNGVGNTLGVKFTSIFPTGRRVNVANRSVFFSVEKKNEQSPKFY